MKKWMILWASILVAVALIVTLCLVFDDSGDGAVDTDGDGRPDAVDEEVDDNLDGDNKVNVDDFFN